MATRMRQRRGTAAEWAADNPILADGEIGYERDTKIIKMGDGITAWNDLTNAQRNARMSDLDDHAALTNPHSATAAPTADRLILRDAAGRAKVVAPAAADDIARKAETDAVQANLNAHGNAADPHGQYATDTDLSNHAGDGGAHGANTGSVGNSIARRDNSGDIHARLFRSEYDPTNASVNLIMTQVDSVNNNYIRPSTPAQVAAALKPHLGVDEDAPKKWALIL